MLKMRTTITLLHCIKLKMQIQLLLLLRLFFTEVTFNLSLCYNASRKFMTDTTTGKYIKRSSSGTNEYIHAMTSYHTG